MSASHAEQLEQLMTQYRKQFAELQETQRRLREISCTVTAPRRTVAVTVGHGGVVKDVEFPTGAYKRMAPADLASTILKVIADAQQQARREAAEVMAPSLPSGVDGEELFSGDVDLQSLLKAEPELHEVTRDAMDIKD